MRFPICSTFVLTAGVVVACRSTTSTPPTVTATTTTTTPTEPTPSETSARADADLARPLFVDPSAVNWSAGPEALPAGAQISLIEGAPSFPAGKTFSMLVRFPANYTIPPHTHLATERITVLQGRFLFGHGDKAVREEAVTVEPGGLIMVPRDHAHYAFTGDQEAVLLLQGIGPWGIHYVNPDDDPRQPPPEKPTVAVSPLESKVDATIMHADQVSFVDPPPGMLPAGAKMAVLEGDPKTSKSFVVRLRFPDGYRIPVHTHSITDRVTVLQGDFWMGMGTTYDRSLLQPVGSGAVGMIPRDQPHFALAQGDTVIQLFGVGPFDIVWHDQADDPSHAPAAEPPASTP
jgi:quercetin dioxygenase-like cupin family protein